MAKWADYLISAVRFNSAHTHINQVKVHEDLDSSVGASQIVSRQDIIASLKVGYTYCTIFAANNGGWDRGQEVERITIDNVEYIKTLPDKLKVDNLDNLPEF